MVITGINIPIRIGAATVMHESGSGRQGRRLPFPAQVSTILTGGPHIHDEWSRTKFSEGKYKSARIYSDPDPALEEISDYLDKRLAELKKEREGSRQPVRQYQIFV